jgi:hypothetical protein
VDQYNLQLDISTVMIWLFLSVQPDPILSQPIQYKYRLAYIGRRQTAPPLVLTFDVCAILEDSDCGHLLNRRSDRSSDGHEGLPCARPELYTARYRCPCLVLGLLVELSYGRWLSP